MAIGSYPARLGIEAPLEVKNWRPLVHWLLAIPHILILYGLGVLRQVLTIVAFFTILFTGKYPAGLRSFLIGISRWSWRVSAYAGLLRDEYPPFSLENGSPLAAAPPAGSVPPPPDDQPDVPPPPPPPAG
jgi:hypothetical protein